MLTKQRFKRRVWSYWWFWIVLVGLCIITWYAKTNFDNQVLSDKQVEMWVQNQVIKRQNELNAKQLKDTEDMLKADNYGGKTPEETLRLFVQALKDEDPVLASKYYLPWKQTETETEMRDWIDNYPDGLDKFLSAYDNGVIKQGLRAVNKAIEIYPLDEEQFHYTVELAINKQTNLWKITDF